MHELDVPKAHAYAPPTEAELDTWERRASGADEGSAEEILRLIGEVRRLRRALATDTLTVQIVRDPGKCGGAPTISGTRIGVHDVVSYARLYEGDLQRVRDEALPHLSPEQVRAAMEFYAAHTDEIEAILRH